MTAPQIIFHAGAHKTATTHLQRSIGDKRDALHARGVAFFGPRDLRHDVPTLGDRFGIGPHAPEVTQLQALATRDRMLGGATRLVLSEENFIGGINNRQGRVSLPLYRHAEERLGALATKIAPQGLTLALALRHPARLMSSAYVQHLMAGGTAGLQDLRGHLDPARIDWTELVKRISAVPGVSEVVVWRYEDYAALFGAITWTLLGEAGDLVSPITRRVHDSLSQPAVDWVLANPSDSAVDQARAKFPVGDGHPAFSHFDAAQIAAEDKRYARQVARIAKLPKVTLLRP